MDQNGIANRSPLATNAARDANKNKCLWTGTRLVPVHKRQVVEIIYGIVVFDGARPGGFG
jgi:hypothetical protein